MRLFGRRTAPTFGIITALPEEFSAMREMIERRASRSVAGDPARYVYGVMPSALSGEPHGVVLTLLGETGNDLAAHGCANLVRSFPSVQQILMVGIAAGVPAPQRPLRLGDVVVATWGIVDFDHVVETDTDRALRQGFPRPSPLLVRCARELQVQEQLGHRPWEALVEQAQRRLPEFARPPASTDILVSATDPAPAGPTVHHGRIGSADRSVRSATARDAVAAEHQLSAIEMEGKGLGRAAAASQRQWFVVRGISDYGDQHTDHRWRKYAALAAAGYTAALLAQCPPLEATERPHRHRRVGLTVGVVAGLVLAATVPAMATWDGWPPVRAEGDEFTTPGAPDASRWGVYSSTEGNGSLMSAEAVRVEAGELRITGHGRVPVGAVSGGLCWCGGNHRYGKWQVRARFDPGAGYGPFVGLWPESGHGGDGFITLARLFQADRRVVECFVNWTGGGVGRGHLDGDFTQWHTYAVEWRESRITITVDGAVAYDSRSSPDFVPPREPMHLVLQQHVGPQAELEAPGPATPDKVVMHVDWVRYDT